MIDYIYRAVEKYPNDLMMAYSTADIRTREEAEEDCGADGNRRRPRDRRFVEWRCAIFTGWASAT